MKTCPKCGGPLRAAYKEHVDYPISNISEDGMVDIEEHNADQYDSDFIHIACDKCDKYWYSVGDFIEECKKTKNADDNDGAVPFVAIGPEDLDDTQEVHAGDEILCPTCKEWHQLLAGKDSKGVDSELLLAYKCGDKTYIAAVDNKLVVKWPKGPGVSKFRKGSEKPKEANANGHPLIVLRHRSSAHGSRRNDQV